MAQHATLSILRVTMRKKFNHSTLKSTHESSRGDEFYNFVVLLSQHASY